MINPSYLSLYVILDIDYLKTAGKNPLKALKDCLKGGATCVQLRSKIMEDNEFYETAIACKNICLSYKVPFIINDRLDVAILIKADGIHIGKEDLSFKLVKKLFKGIIGISSDNEKESYVLDSLKASYMGIGPVYPTLQKNKKAVGIKSIKKLCSTLFTPIVAIGGINEYNIPELKRSGIKYFSFISGILGSKNILAKTKKVSSIIYHKEI